MARVLSNVSPEDVEQMTAILERLVGTKIEPTGDIKINVNGVDYVIESQSGAAYVASVLR